jgi:hypothetical protein
MVRDDMAEQQENDCDIFELITCQEAGRGMTTDRGGGVEEREARQQKTHITKVGRDQKKPGTMSHDGQEVITLDIKTCC